MSNKISPEKDFDAFCDVSGNFFVADYCSVSEQQPSSSSMDLGDELFIPCKNQAHSKQNQLIPEDDSVIEESANLQKYALKYGVVDAAIGAKAINRKSNDNKHIPTEITFMNSKFKILPLFNIPSIP